MKTTIRFDILNTLQSVVKETKSTLINATKIKEIKQLYAEQGNFNLKDYSIILCRDQYDLYETLIHAIVESYTNIIGIPHIVCGIMEHPDIIIILNKLVKSKHIIVTYVCVDIYGAVPVVHIKNAILANTALLIISYTNYLIGTFNNITDIAQLAQNAKVPLFCDCIYTYGKLNKLQLTDIFSIGFNNIHLLTIKNILIDGYKLNHHCDAMQSSSEKALQISNAQYKQIMQVLISKRFTNNTVNTKVYLLAQLKSKYTLYYYNAIITESTILHKNDIIILGYNDMIKCVSNTVSLIVMSNTAITIKKKLEKKDMLIMCASKPFENIGLIVKWSKYVITINLDNCTNANIDLLISCL